MRWDTILSAYGAHTAMGDRIGWNWMRLDMVGVGWDIRYESGICSWIRYGSGWNRMEM